MALAPADLLTGVKAAHPSCFTRAYRLTIQNRSTRLAVPTGCLPHSFSQRVMNPLPRSLTTPQPEGVIDRAPGRQIVRQQFPGTAAAHGIEDTVQNLTAAMFYRTATRLGR